MWSSFYYYFFFIYLFSNIIPEKKIIRKKERWMNTHGRIFVWMGWKAKISLGSLFILENVCHFIFILRYYFSHFRKLKGKRKFEIASRQQPNSQATHQAADTFYYCHYYLPLFLLIKVELTVVKWRGGR